MFKNLRPGHADIDPSKVMWTATVLGTTQGAL